jgi:hypothetical protein
MCQIFIKQNHYEFWPYKLQRGAIMKTLAALFQTALLLTVASIAFSQSLGDLAKKENERRKEIKDEKVITDEEAASYQSNPVKTNVRDQSAAKPDSADQATTDSKKAKPESDEPVDFEGRPESYWRKTMDDARQKVKELEDKATELTLKVNNLQNQFYREDSGFKREDIQRELQKTYYEQDKNKEDLAKAKDVLQDLDKEARKSGALPGWLGPKE